MIHDIKLEGRWGEENGGEDHIEVTRGFYAVLDGITGRGRALKEGLRMNGTTPGRWAALTVGETLAEMENDIEAEEASRRIQKALKAGMERAGISPEEWGWPAATQICIYSRYRREIWRLGDIHAAVDGQEIPPSPTPLDIPALGYRAAVLWGLVASGEDMERLRANDPTREMITPLLELQHHLRNCPDTDNPYAYWLHDGREIPGYATQVHKVAQGAEVVIATDGYPRAAPTLEHAEAELEHILRNDKLLIRLHQGFRPLAPGATSFDDRAYLRFTAESTHDVNGRKAGA